MTSKVLREDKNGVAVLSLNRPEKLNSLNVALFLDLLKHIDEIEADTNGVGCVVIRGAGKCFSAGHDLEDITTGEDLPRPNFQAEIIERLACLPQPVIAAVHGHCYTGALELALASDIILAASNAKFADTHAKWGLTPVWGLSQRLPRRIGAAKAYEMMFACRTYSGDEAAAMGLANACFPDDEFDAAVARFTEDIVENCWFSNRVNKKLLIETGGLPLHAGLAHEMYKSPGLGPNTQTRLAVFSERRKGK